VKNLKFNLANSYQQESIGSMDAKTFLELEGCSATAKMAAVVESLETLGAESPCVPHLESLIRDYGKLPDNNPELFEVLLKAYSLVGCSPAPEKRAEANILYDKIVQMVGPRTADKAFRRLMARGAQQLAKLPDQDANLVGQAEIDALIVALEQGDIAWV